MESMLRYIDNKNNEFAKRKIFDWLKDKSISPRQRLGLAPYMAHFVFSFMDVNRFVLRDLDNDDALQQLVNIHTNEDSHHWPWYLKDLALFGLDKVQPLSESLSYIWGDHCIKSRMITYEMVAIARTLTPKQKVVLVEVIEKTGNVFLSLTADVCREAGLEGQSLYYGDNHLACETGHTMGTQDIETLLCNIQMTEEERRAGQELIDKVYVLYHDFVDEMYDFVINTD
jgi:hypothetical protein